MKTGAVIAKSVENDIKLYIYSGIYAVIVSAMLVIGREMTVYRGFFTPLPKLALRFLGVWLAAFAVTALLWKLLDKINSRRNTTENRINLTISHNIYIYIYSYFVRSRRCGSSTSRARFSGISPCSLPNMSRGRYQEASPFCIRFLSDSLSRWAKPFSAAITGELRLRFLYSLR